MSLRRLIHAIYPATRADAKKILTCLRELLDKQQQYSNLEIFNPSYERFTNSFVEAWRNQNPSALLPVPLDFARVCEDLILPNISVKSEICLCDVAIGEGYRSLVGPCLQTHKAYAIKHNMDYYTLRDKPNCVGADRHPAWAKIPLLYQLLRAGYAKVHFVDADTMIKNDTLTWGHFFSDLPAQQFFCVAPDEVSYINSGVMLFKRSPFALALLAAIWGGANRKYLNQPHWEQDSLLHLASEYPEVQEMMHIAPPRVLESCPPAFAERYKTSNRHCYQKGDFLVHFKDMKGENLARLIEEYRKV